MAMVAPSRRKIAEKHAAGFSVSELAREFEVDRHTVRREPDQARRAPTPTSLTPAQLATLPALVATVERSTCPQVRRRHGSAPGCRRWGVPQLRHQPGLRAGQTKCPSTVAGRCRPGHFQRLEKASSRCLISFQKKRQLELSLRL